MPEKCIHHVTTSKSQSLTIVHSPSFCRCFVSWQTRDVTNTIKGYKLNLQEMLNSKVPNNVLSFVIKHTYFRKSIRKLKAAGFDGYTEDEIEAMGKKDLDVLSDLLGEKQFFFGDEPRMLDLRAFVYLSLVLGVDKEVECPLRDYMEEKTKNLVGMYNRLKVRTRTLHQICFNGKNSFHLFVVVFNTILVHDPLESPYGAYVDPN